MKTNITETKVAPVSGLLGRYLSAHGINPRFVTKDVKIAHSKSNKFKKWRRDHWNDPTIDAKMSTESVNEMDNGVMSRGEINRAAWRNSPEGQKEIARREKEQSDREEKFNAARRPAYAKKKSSGLIKPRKKVTQPWESVEQNQNVIESKLAMPLKGHEYHKKSDTELRYIRKDAHAAAEDMKGHNTNAENKYRDQVNDAETVLHYRSKGGAQLAKEEWSKTPSGSYRDSHTGRLSSNSDGSDGPVPTPRLSRNQKRRAASVAKFWAKRAEKDKKPVEESSNDINRLRQKDLAHKTEKQKTRLKDILAKKKDYIETEKQNSRAAAAAKIGMRKENMDITESSGHKILARKFKDIQARKVKDEKNSKDTANTKSESVVTVGEDVDRNYSTKRVSFATWKKNSFPSDTEKKPKPKDKKPVSKKDINESKMAELHADVGDLVDHHIKNYKAGKLGADSFGEKIIGAHHKLAKMYSMPHEHAKKFVNDYVDSNLKEEMDKTKRDNERDALGVGPKSKKNYKDWEKSINDTFKSIRKANAEGKPWDPSSVKESTEQPEVYGQPPKHKKTDVKSIDGKHTPARAILVGGKTLTGSPRDKVEIDPALNNQPGQPVFNNNAKKAVS